MVIGSSKGCVVRNRGLRGVNHSPQGGEESCCLCLVYVCPQTHTNLVFVFVFNTIVVISLASCRSREKLIENGCGVLLLGKMKIG